MFFCVCSIAFCLFIFRFVCLAENRFFSQVCLYVLFCFTFCFSFCLSRAFYMYLYNVYVLGVRTYVLGVRMFMVSVAACFALILHVG